MYCSSADGRLVSALADGATADSPETDLKELLAVLQRDEKNEIIEANDENLSVIKTLGGSQSKYRRERKRAVKAIVSEGYLPPRVTAATKLLPELKCMPGFALDLTTADADGRLWDFDEKVMRGRALSECDVRSLFFLWDRRCARRSRPGNGSMIRSGTSSW